MKFKIDESKAQLRRRVKQVLCGGAVLGLAMTMGTQSAVAGDGYAYGYDDFATVTPYNRVAKLKIVRNTYGEIDYAATYAKGKAAAAYLADYVARNVDSDVLGASTIKGGDWVLGGTSKNCRKNPTLSEEEGGCTDDEISHAILQIPSPEPINPNDPDGFKEDGTPTPANTKKASVLDFCNEHYAKQALGVAPIIGDKKVVNGYSHTPALPCEVSIWNDDKHIYVDMLDPNAIFSLFFTDVLFSDDMQDPDFAEALSDLPPQVKSEIRAIILHAMNEFDAETKVMDKQLGPQFRSMDEVVGAVASSPEGSPYKHVGYTRTNGKAFTLDDSKAVTQAIINTMSIHGAKDADGNDIAGIHPTEIDKKGNTLDSILSPKSSWRSARPTPLTLPGYNHVIEACSPKYAKMAMSTGLHHVTALPCEITVQIIDRDGNGSKESLVVSYLDPHFMLGALFADISEEDQRAFADIPGNIMADLQKVVAAALEHTPASKIVDIRTAEPIVYNMLP
jgi:uncharacterized protein (DUF302 family)